MTAIRIAAVAMAVLYGVLGGIVIIGGLAEQDPPMVVLGWVFVLTSALMGVLTHLTPRRRRARRH